MTCWSAQDSISMHVPFVQFSVTNVQQGLSHVAYSLTLQSRYSDSYMGTLSYCCWHDSSPVDLSPSQLQAETPLATICKCLNYHIWWFDKQSFWNYLLLQWLVLIAQGQAHGCIASRYLTMDLSCTKSCNKSSTAKPSSSLWANLPYRPCIPLNLNIKGCYTHTEHIAWYLLMWLCSCIIHETSKWLGLILRVVLAVTRCSRTANHTTISIVSWFHHSHFTFGSCMKDDKILDVTFYSKDTSVTLDLSSVSERPLYSCQA